MILQFLKLTQESHKGLHANIFNAGAISNMPVLIW